MNETPLRILLIGPMPPPVGGTAVLFKNLVDALGARSDVSTVGLSSGGVRGRRLRGAFRFISLFWRIMRAARVADVVTLHASTTGVPLIGPIVAGLAWLWRKPLIVRKFGGTDFQEFARVPRALAEWTVRCADLYLVETKRLVRLANEQNVKRVEWYSNYRVLPGGSDPTERSSHPCRRFVFLSQVRPSKGIAELVTAGERFNEDVSVDVYGPLFPGVSEDTFAGLERVQYRGVVEPEDVVNVLRQYDAVVLPTSSPTEGYPGTVIESYAVGLPVITTNCGSIPEIVDESCGILIEPKDADALYDAMARMVTDDALYAQLCRGAQAKRQQFDAEVWTQRFVDHCKELARGRT